jgi:hypothetical protein
MEEILQTQNELSVIQQRRKDTPKHIPWTYCTNMTTDCFKMVASRRETVMACILLLKWPSRMTPAPCDKNSSARKRIWRDSVAKVLHVRVHPSLNPRWNQALSHLLRKLSEAGNEIRGCDLQIKYCLGFPDH